MTREDFEQLVADAVENIPEFFKEKLDNVDIVVESWPPRQFSRGRLLLGLYQGVPATAWGRGSSLVLPDKITIFQGPIEFLARENVERVKEIVIDTVEHEIAHHFGISDLRIKELKNRSI